MITFNLLFFYLFSFNSIKGESSKKSEEYFIVTRIVDGDTIKINDGRTIRLICVDTPEFGEIGSNKATLYLESLILYKKVRLEKDASETDLYNRTLRYLYLDGQFINKDIVEKGFARAYPIYPDTTLCPEILEAEKRAKSAQLEIWAEEYD